MDANKAGRKSPLLLRTLDGTEVTLDHEDLDKAALEWSYIVRRRARWNQGERARRALAERSADLLQTMGVRKHDLEHAAQQGLVEVSIRWEKEEYLWPARVLPWEFLLSAATRPYREERPLTVVRHLDRSREIRVPKRRQLGAPLAVVSAPDRVGAVYSFDSERALVRRRLQSGRADVFLAAKPLTLSRIREQVAGRSPRIVHLAGVDSHQGGEILGWSENRRRGLRDGMVLLDADGVPTDVAAEPLGNALVVGENGPPELVVFNFYRSAARTAAVVVGCGAGVALGFQDTFEDLAAERFLNEFYRAWEAKAGPLIAFLVAWRALRDVPARLEGSGIVLWSERSLAAPVNEGRVSKLYDESAAQSKSAIKLHGKADAKNALSHTIKPRKRINYGLLHNHEPLFSTFRLVSQRDGILDDVKVEVELFAGDQNLPCSLLRSIGTAPVALDKDLFVPLTSRLARNLRESIRASLRARVTVGRYETYNETHPVTLLPINEWVDDDHHRQWLPSFVFPQDRGVRRVVDRAQKYLAAITGNPSAGFDGYQSVNWKAEDPTALVDAQVAAMWAALVLDMALAYVNPPPTYTYASQRLRIPSDVVDGRRGTCIDLALLLAACLEYVNIFPVIFLLEGHAFPGYWRSLESWLDFMEMSHLADLELAELDGLVRQSTIDSAAYSWMFGSSDYTEIMRQIEHGNLVPIETVWLTTRSSFDEALKEGWENLANPKDFHALLDITRAREADVTPLPLVDGLGQAFASQESKT
jgi:uncharacterized protein YjiS (DUF1127 family)